VIWHGRLGQNRELLFNGRLSRPRAHEATNQVIGLAPLGGAKRYDAPNTIFHHLDGLQMIVPPQRAKFELTAGLRIPEQVGQAFRSDVGH
jgi:hypothetical protein